MSIIPPGRNRTRSTAALLTALCAAVVNMTNISHAEAPVPRPQIADMYLQIGDTRQAWASGRQIDILAYGWAGEELRIPLDRSEVRELTADQVRQPVLTVRKFQDDLSTYFQESFESSLTLESVYFVVEWPGGESHRYLLSNARIIGMRTMATGEVAALPYEEISFAYEAVESVENIDR